MEYFSSLYNCRVKSFIRNGVLFWQNLDSPEEIYPVFSGISSGYHLDDIFVAIIDEKLYINKVGFIYLSPGIVPKEVEPDLERGIIKLRATFKLEEKEATILLNYDGSFFL